MMAIEADDRGLEQLGHRGYAGIDDLPGQQRFPVARDDADHVSDVVRIVIPVRIPTMAQFIDQYRRAPLGEEQDRETGRQDLLRFVECAHPEASEFLLLVDELSAPEDTNRSCQESECQPAARPAPGRKDNKTSIAGRC